METPITVLRFGSSLDFSGDLPPGTRAWEVAEAMLSSATGRPVRTVVKPVWPSARVPALLDRWLAEVEPDLILICISSYWVETEILSTRFRRLGPLGRKVESVTQAAAMKPSFAESRPYLLGRKALLHTIGGRPNFSPAEIEGHVESWLRVILQRESVGAAVVGTPFSPDTLATRGARRRAHGRKDELRARLKALCQRLDVHYEMPPHAPDAFAPELRLPDRVHFNEQAHARMGEIDGRALIAVWDETSPATHTPAKSSQLS